MKACQFWVGGVIFFPVKSAKVAEVYGGVSFPRRFHDEGVKIGKYICLT
jgi:hypothetical protein